MGSKSSKRRCQIGKGCGASCIQRSKECLLDLADNVSGGLSKAASASKKVPSASVGASPLPKKIGLIDRDIEFFGISKRIGDPSYDWSHSNGPRSKFLGQGSFGVVTTDPVSGAVVKRGDISPREPELIDKLGKLGLGPKVVAAQLDGEGFEPNTKTGRIAMSFISGEAIGRSREPDDEIGGQKVSDAYWRARASAHRAGIAHNDMHIDNVIIDSKGKARLIDLGFGQDMPKAALAEALGAFALPLLSSMKSRDYAKGAGMEGDWQAMRWKGTGVYLLGKESEETLKNRVPVLHQVHQNFDKVSKQLAQDGFSPQEINSIVAHGIRSRDDSFNEGPWGKISDAQALKYINMLYEGV